MTTTTATMIPLRHIRLNGGTQPRAELNEEHIDRLKSALEEGEELPPIVCYHDGSDYWLADGFHRVQAHYRAMRIDITAEVRQGTRRDAVLYSLSANRTHGLPRTRADMQRAIQTMLADAEWSRCSDREIARTVGCSHATVGTIRAKLESTGQIDQLPARIGADGKERSTARVPGSGPCPIC
ncbi:MAG: streptomycin biosynthesis regulator, partial [Chloroflexia bacterium]|nr:streptomycin biosynthesis regulator [Chloroflexia bacterium]